MSLKNILAKLKNNYLLSASFIYVLGTLLVKGISFLTTPIFTRIMNTSDFGIVSTFTSWVSIFSVFIAVQISGTIPTARVHKEKSDFIKYISNCLLLSALSFLIITAIVMINAEHMANLFGIEAILVFPMLLQSFGTAMSTLMDNYFIQTKQPKIKTILSVCTALLSVTLGIIFVLSFDNKYLGRIVAFVVVYTLMIAIAYGFFARKRFQIHVKFSLKDIFADWKYCLALSIPLIFHLLSNIIISQSDRIFIIHMMDSEAVAIYNVAYSIGSIGLIVADACNLAWSPWYLENTKLGNNQQINNALKKYSLIVSTGFVYAFLLAPEVLAIMAPESYSGGIYCVLIVLAGIFFQFLYRFPLAYEQYKCNLKWVAVCTAISAILNVVLNYFMIPVWGIEGAAIATLLSYMLLYVLHEIVARKVIKGYNMQSGIYLKHLIVIGIALVASFVTIHYLLIRIGILVIWSIIAVKLLMKKAK